MKRIISKYYDELHDNKYDNLDEIDKLLEIYNDSLRNRKSEQTNYQ